MRYKARVICICLVIFSIVLSGCSISRWTAPKSYKETQFLMDTVMQITAYGPNSEEAVKAAFSEFQRYHDLTNIYDPKSQVSRVNQMAGKEKVQVDPDLIKIMQYSISMASKLDGTFDVTVGPLTALWGIGKKGEFVPSAEEIQRVLPLVNYRLVEVDAAANTIFLPKEGMSIDLGGIAKGYATDQAIAILKSKGITSALVNAGGAVCVIGKKPDGSSWRVGVQDPRDSDGIAAKLALSNWISMETSGDYQRYFIKDGTRFAHILDPRTGVQPREVASVTIVGPDASYGEVLGKALFVMGIQKGTELLKQFPGNEAIFIGLDGKITVTSGLEGKIEE